MDSGFSNAVLEAWVRFPFMILGVILKESCIRPFKKVPAWLVKRVIYKRYLWIFFLYLRQKPISMGLLYILHCSGEELGITWRRNLMILILKDFYSIFIFQTSNAIPFAPALHFFCVLKHLSTERYLRE